MEPSAVGTGYVCVWAPLTLSSSVVIDLALVVPCCVRSCVELTSQLVHVRAVDCGVSLVAAGWAECVRVNVEKAVYSMPFASELQAAFQESVLVLHISDRDFCATIVFVLVLQDKPHGC